MEMDAIITSPKCAIVAPPITQTRPMFSTYTYGSKITKIGKLCYCWSFCLTSILPLICCLSFDPLLSTIPSGARPRAAVVLHPWIMSITVLGLEVEWPLLLEQVSSNGIADVMASHDVAVHVLLTLCTIKSAEVNLANELSTSRAFL